MDRKATDGVATKSDAICHTRRHPTLLSPPSDAATAIAALAVASFSTVSFSFNLRCLNIFEPDTVMVHLYRNGFKPRYFVWIDHGERDGLNDMFYNSMPVDDYNMLAPHGQIRVEHDRVHEIINDAFRVQGGMEPEQYFDKAPNEEARCFYDQLEESSRPLCEGSPHSALLVAVRLMNIKSDWNVPNAAMNSMVDILGELVNPEFNIPKNSIKLSVWFPS
ncbi:hypothetical protein H5410_030261 [Solanum commersonii]|uniref:Uncharacterized protein n=1 Tax=Solanum commersonii TaxID=4109 RepID=A0A9J5YDT1_SOLCO|nr:hypothetical protein H5410_030261 [Solanum commersonii]